MEKKPFVIESEDYVAIVGTNDRDVARIALLEAEEQWYGKDQTEPHLDVDLFSFADIYYGVHNGEEMHYWGSDPQVFFEKGEYETVEGFVGTWEDIKK